MLLLVLSSSFRCFSDLEVNTSPPSTVSSSLCNCPLPTVQHHHRPPVSVESCTLVFCLRATAPAPRASESSAVLRPRFRPSWSPHSSVPCRRLPLCIPCPPHHVLRLCPPNVSPAPATLDSSCPDLCHHHTLSAAIAPHAVLINYMMGRE